MAELLIKAIDSRMPTVEEWRRQLVDHVVPKALEFFNKWPDGDIVNEAKSRYEEYESAISVLRSVSESAEIIESGKSLIGMESERQTSAFLAVSRYEDNPLTQADVDKINLYHRPTDIATGDPLPVGVEAEHTGLPLIFKHNYYKNQIESEVIKSDQEKAIELANKDRSGCSKIGDVIVVMPTGHEWGREECPPVFIAITVEDAEYEDLKYLEKPHENNYVVDVNGEEDHKVDTLIKRRWSVNIANLTHRQTIKLADLMLLITDKSKE